MTDSPRSALKVDATALVTHLVEDRRAAVSRWGLGNSKLGRHVYTYSRTAGSVATCPGATAACEAVCYAQRMATPENGLADLFDRNAVDTVDADGLPADAEIVRIHVSGDFDSLRYIDSWIRLVRSRSSVRFFGYTRSWALDTLRPALDRLRAEPNVQLFASVDRDHAERDVMELVEDGWRLSIMGEDVPWELARYGRGDALIEAVPGREWDEGESDGLSDGLCASQTGIVCPEETGAKTSCETCRYCIDGRRGAVLFPVH